MCIYARAYLYVMSVNASIINHPSIRYKKKSLSVNIRLTHTPVMIANPNMLHR